MSIDQASDVVEAVALTEDNPLAETTVESEYVAETSGPRDPYTLSEDGHFVGHDGFVVPKDFAEFYERFPRWVRGFVRQHQYNLSEGEVGDREHELLLHLMTLPKDSKYRDPGYNGQPNGCVDRIMVFNPSTGYGASEARFRFYINQYCLLNHLRSLQRKQGSNPIMRVNVVSLYSMDSDGEIVDDNYIERMTSETYRSGCHYAQRLEESLHINQFILFVGEHNPELVPVMDAIANTDTYVEVQRRLRISEKLLIRARNRLGVLWQHFAQGTEPARQRRVYRSRRNLGYSRTSPLDNLIASVV
jgi:hypothetical protein